MENELKQVLCVATPETSENYRWEKNSHLIDESRVCIVDLETIKGMEAQGIKFERETAPITEGMVFGLHPYKQNCYIDLAMEESKVLHRKIDLLEEFCKYLGVTSVKFEATLVKEVKRDLNVSGGMQASEWLEASAQYRREQTQNDMASYKREGTYSGAYTIKDYEKAQELYNRIGYNAELEHFMKQRNPNDSNKMLSKKIIIELSSEMNDLTDIASNLTGMNGLFKLNARFVENVSIKRIIKYEMTLNFSA